MLPGAIVLIRMAKGDNGVYLFWYQEIMGTLRNSMFNFRYQEFMGTLGDTAIYNFEKNTGCPERWLLGIYQSKERLRL
jgi:hypothetical protein